ncbi:MAG: hypothetical protein WAW37_02565 [Syntrophobacteraceae bacterium]
MSPNELPRNVFPDIFPPREIRILGAGRFGRTAAERLKRRFPEALISVTDKDASRVEKIRAEVGINGEVGDSLGSITERALPEDVWVIPAVPVHVGFEWTLRELDRTGTARRLPVPRGADFLVPNPMRSPSGTLYASFATFICPDYCSEPDEICTTTGKARPGDLFEVFGGIALPDFGTAVLRSWQLSPGVGGYPVRSLDELLAVIRAKPGKYLVATSCRCHGVMDALEWGRD